MATSIQQVLNPFILTGMITEQAGGVPKFCPDLPELDTKTVKASYDILRYLMVKDTRQSAPQRPYGSPASQAAQQAIRDKQVTIPSFGPEFIQFTMSDLRNLMGYNGPAMMEKGSDEITRQSKQFAIRYGNARQVAKAQLFANAGKIYWDSHGNFSTTDLSASGGVTMDSLVPSGNKTTCGDAAFGTANLAGTTSTGYWTDPNTPILYQIAGLKRQALKTSGLPIKIMMYGIGIPTLLKQNVYVKAMSDYQSVMANKFALGEIPDKFLGIDKWVPAGEWFYEDSAGTNQSLIGDNFLAAMPDFSAADWYAMGLGQTDVPKRFSLTAMSVEELLGDIRTVEGLYQYAVPLHNPLRLQMFMGDCAAPLFTNPNAPFFPTVAA